MNLNAPKQITFIISVLLAALALLSTIGIVSQTAGSSAWIALLAYVVLAAGNMMKGL